MAIPDPATLQQILVEAVSRHNVLPLTGRCNVSCCFCSHNQNPPGTLAYNFPPLEAERLLELIPFLDPNEKIVIGESATRLREGEPLTHPQFFSVLEHLRRHFPAAVLQITTNGSLLGDDQIRRLASLAPLELVLSLNSASKRGRRLLMGDPQPEHAIAAVEKLVQAGIPLHGSMVAMPHLVGWEDLTFALEFLSGAGARTIRLLLPGYTRCSLPTLTPPPGTLERCWDLAGRLQGELKAPLLVEPPRVDNFDPQIEGVIAGSPAGRAGLKTGDRILTVDGHVPVSRVDAFTRARRLKNPRLTALRNGTNLQIELVKEQGETPGFAVSYDLDPDQVKRVCRNLGPGKETLMLLSSAAYPRWQLAREHFQLEGLRLAAVLSKFFGGNINCAGLLTVSDFASVLQQQHRALPARILIPAAAFDSSGRDLQGRHYSILSDLGATVTLVE